MSNRITGRLIFLALLTAFLYVSSGCNEATILGQDLIPGSDNVNTLQTDTFTVVTHSMFNADSIVTSGRTELAAGMINTDPVFGKTTAIAYSQFGLLTGAFDFDGTNPVLDSVVLSVEYSGYYGDSLGLQNFSVYRITDPNFTDSATFYAWQQPVIDNGQVLGATTVSAHGLQDSVSVYGEMQSPQLRIKLSNTFGDALIHQKSSGAFANDSTFHSWLRGLAVLPDTTTAGKNSLLYLYLNSEYTGITVYYHNDSDDSLQAFFPYNSTSSASSNYISHDFTGSEAEQYFGDSTTVDSLLYLEDRSGLYADISLPYLQTFPNAVLNKAELVLTQIADPASDVFTPPGELFLRQYQNAKKDSLGFVFDAGVSFDPYSGSIQFGNLAYFGGFRTPYTNEDGQRVVQYRFNITRFMQHLISQSGSFPETNYGFRLEVLDPQGSTRNAGRVLLGGADHAKYALKLHVVYTKIQ